LARVTGGRVLAAEQLKQIVQSLADLPETPPTVRRVPLWSHPFSVALMVVLLGIFWSLRKIVGLI
jgi:hypothetical protein